MGEPSESSVIDYLTLLVEERGPTPGAYLGAELIRAFPSFDLRARGHRSLTGFLDARADRLAVVGRSGVDLVWGLDGAEADDPSSGPSEEHPTRGDGDPSWPEIASAELSIERMVLRNYRSCAETTLELSDITALVGANGTGKSTLLEALYLGCRASAGKPRTIFSRRRDLHRMRTIGRDGPVVVSFEMSHDGSLRFEGTPTSDGGRFEVVARAGAREHTWQYPPPPEQRVPLGTTPPAMACRPVLLLKLRADRLARPSAVQDEQPRVAYDGTGLASVLAHLAATDPERMDRIVERVRRLVPQVEQVRMPRKTQSRQTTEVHWFEGRATERRVEREVLGNELEVKVRRTGWVPADQMSEGTLLMLGLHTVLEQQSQPRLLLLDDVDRGLHPKAQRILVEQLTELSERPSLKICFSTHSPFVLDQVPAHSVRVVRLDPSVGHTVCPRLSDRPEWQEWKKSMTAGEFWQFVGEDWLDTDGGKDLLDGLGVDRGREETCLIAASARDDDSAKDCGLDDFRRRVRAWLREST